MLDIIPNSNANLVFGKLFRSRQREKELGDGSFKYKPKTSMERVFTALNQRDNQYFQ